MRRLLYITFVITSLTGFSQEKKGICSSLIILYHNYADPLIVDDYFTTSGFTFDHAAISGGFQIDSTTWVDSLIYVITIPEGDLLQYSAYWHADGMCYSVDSTVINHMITFLEGAPFPITYEGEYSPVLYNFSQEGWISDPCLFKIQRSDIPNKPYFIRIKFQNPPAPETPLDLSEITNEISMWFDNENTLFVETDPDAIWEINLYSLSGQVIRKQTLESSQALDVSSLPKGCYIAHVSSVNGLKKQLRFIR